MVFKKFYDPVYRVNVLFVGDCSFTDFKKKINQNGLQPPDDSHQNSEGMHAVFEGHQPTKKANKLNTVHVVWVRDKDDLPCLVHEITHLTVSVFDRRGIAIDDTDITEAVAYYLEHWVDRLWPLLSQRKKKA